MSSNRTSSISKSGWKNLPPEISCSIAHRLKSTEYLQFSMVCKSWLSTAKDIQREHGNELDCQPPMVLIPAGKNGIWKLYNVIDDKVMNLQFNLGKKRFCGSSKGWLIFLDANYTVTLVNPLLRLKGKRKEDNSIIHLPTLAPRPDWAKLPCFIARCNHMAFKATISADPILNANECVVFVIYEDLCQLAFIRLKKDEKWTYLEDFESWDRIHEVVPLKDKFYAITHESQLLSFDITAKSNLDVKMLTCAKRRKQYWKVYLVSLNETELLMVHRCMYHDENREERVTKNFEIFTLDRDRCEWTKKDSLDDVALFLGDNSSIAVVASKFQGCQPNCIYFNFDNEDWIGTTFADTRHYDFGVYDLKSRTINSRPYNKVAMTLMKNSIRPPIWIVPTLQL